NTQQHSAGVIDQQNTTIHLAEFLDDYVNDLFTHICQVVRREKIGGVEECCCLVERAHFNGIAVDCLVKLGIFNGDCRLVSENAQTFGMKRGEGIRHVRVEVEKTDHMVVGANRHAEIRAHPIAL